MCQVASTKIGWRSSDDIPPAARSIGSSYDVEAQSSKKRSTPWVGDMRPSARNP